MNYNFLLRSGPLLLLVSLSLTAITLEQAVADKVKPPRVVVEADESFEAVDLAPVRTAQEDDDKFGALVDAADEEEDEEEVGHGRSAGSPETVCMVGKVGISSSSFG